MLLFNIRCLLCRLFSWHEMECIDQNFKQIYELHECKWCGLHAAVHWHFRTVQLLDYRTWR